VNANIEFKESPFYLQHGLSEWESSSEYPRRALINSFGAGGVNACVILQEYKQPSSSYDRQPAGPYLFTLSAKNEERLREYADRLVLQLTAEPETDLRSLCYTLQAGREAMEERLAIVVSDVNELVEQLNNWNKRVPSTGIYQGRLDSRRRSKRSFGNGATREQSLTELASRWIGGEEVDWESLYPEIKPVRIALPTYPFARERYWISESVIPEKGSPCPAQLHPLISHNSSTLKEVSFSSALSDTAFYAVDHKVNEEKIFPGAGFLEMACVAGNIASEQRIRKVKDIVWIQPLMFRKGPQTLRTFLKHAGESIEYVISSFGDENETILHSEGRLAFKNGRRESAHAADRIPIQELKAQCKGPEEGVAYYDRFRAYGFHYGPSFQTIQKIYVNRSFALSKLKIADHLKGDFGQFILHPCLIDGALQTVAGLLGSLESATPHLPFALDEIDIVHPLPQVCYAYVEFADSSEHSQAGIRKFNIRLLNESGDVLIGFKNLFVRPLIEIPASPHASVERWLAAKAAVASAGAVRHAGEL
jgi:acyl transferase domain-containing protein